MISNEVNMGVENFFHLVGKSGLTHPTHAPIYCLSQSGKSLRLVFVLSPSYSDSSHSPTFPREAMAKKRRGPGQGPSGFGRPRDTRPVCRSVPANHGLIRRGAPTFL